VRILCLMIFLTFYYSNAISQTWFSSDNSVSIGKVVINGQDINSLGTVIKGSGVKKTISRPVSNFHSINSSGVFNIKFRQGKAAVKITGDDNLIDFVITEVINDSLNIFIKKSYSSKSPIGINISSPEVESMTISGASHIELASIKLSSLVLNLLGSTDLYADGEVSRLVLNVNGTGDVRSKSLAADFVTINAQGAADIQVTANKELDVTVSGVGDIVFYGKPQKISKKTSGLGEIVTGE